MFSPEHTRIIVFTFPDDSIPWPLHCWLRQIEIPTANEFSYCSRDIVATRNAAVERLVLGAPPEITDVILCDRDMRPTRHTAAFLRPDADVVACYYETANPAAWAEPDGFHLGLVRVKRRVFQQLDPPWFQFSYNARYTGLTLCECLYFAHRVREAGFSILKSGHCGHAKAPALPTIHDAPRPT